MYVESPHNSLIYHIRKCNISLLKSICNYCLYFMFLIFEIYPTILRLDFLFSPVSYLCGYLLEPSL